MAADPGAGSPRSAAAASPARTAPGSAGSPTSRSPATAATWRRSFSGAAGAIVLIPGAPLIAILVLTRALNAVLLPPLVWFMRGIACDRRIMGEQALGRAGRIATLAASLLVVGCVALWAALLVA